MGNTLTPMYLLRYVNIQTRDGMKAYDLYDTMNRQKYFKDNGAFRCDAAERNIDSLMRIREQSVNAMDAAFFHTHHEAGNYMTLRCMGPQAFWKHHGVEVDMSAWNLQEQDREQQEAVEDAHLLWNFRQDEDFEDFFHDESGETSSITLSDQEIEDLLNQDIGPLDPADAFH
jgi:hypothetical protein